MKSDPTERTFPPPIPGAQSSGSISIVTTLAGIFLTSFIYFFAVGMLSLDLDSDMLAISSVFSQYTMFSLLPVALIADAYMDRRRAIMVGALVTGLGLLAMATGWLLLVIPGLVLFAIGNGMMSISLLAYFGTQWTHKGKEAGYAFAFGFATIGGATGNWLSFSLMGADTQLAILVSALLMVGAFVGYYFLIKRGFLKVEKGGGDKQGKELIGGLLLVLLMIISFIAVGILNFLVPEEGVMGLVFIILTLLIFVPVLLGVSLGSRLMNRGKISMLLLPLIVSLFVCVQPEAAGLAWEGCKSVVGESLSFDLRSFQLTRVYYDLVVFVVAMLVLFLGWRLRYKLKKEVLSVSFLMVGMLLVTLFPQVVSHESMGGLSPVWQLLLVFLYLMGYVMSFAYFYSAAWMYFPVRYRGTGFAVVATCQYLVYKWRALDNIAQAENGSYDQDFLSDSILLMISLGLVFVAVGMALIRLRKH